jgi:hypothetical protein
LAGRRRAPVRGSHSTPAWPSPARSFCLQVSLRFEAFATRGRSTLPPRYHPSCSASVSASVGSIRELRNHGRDAVGRVAAAERLTVTRSGRVRRALRCAQRCHGDLARDNGSTQRSQRGARCGRGRVAPTTGGGGAGTRARRARGSSRGGAVVGCGRGHRCSVGRQGSTRASSRSTASPRLLTRFAPVGRRFTRRARPPTEPSPAMAVRWRGAWAMAVIVQRHIDAEVSGVMFTPAAPDEPTASRPWMLSLMPLRSITLGIGSPEGAASGSRCPSC